MLAKYHKEICRKALGNHFSPRAMIMFIAANLSLDGLRGQIGHPEYHFDDNAFEESYAFIEEQRSQIYKALKDINQKAAWIAFGQLAHTAQDFYAHSNYIRLWAASYPEGERPAPPETPALDKVYLQHPQLASGRVYLWDFVYFIPGLRNLALRNLPLDSHGHMNLDHPGRGPLFPHVMAAAIKRTHFEYQETIQQITAELGKQPLAEFADHESPPTTH